LELLPPSVMAGLDPAIKDHKLRLSQLARDGRIKSGHDDSGDITNLNLNEAGH
jgi:hypothetical protein